MTYKLRVTGDDSNGDFIYLWTNFMIRHVMPSTRYTVDKKAASSFLKEFNARNVFDTPYVEFETKEDALAFTLKFS